MLSNGFILRSTAGRLDDSMSATVEWVDDVLNRVMMARSAEKPETKKISKTDDDRS